MTTETIDKAGGDVAAPTENAVPIVLNDNGADKPASSKDAQAGLNGPDAVAQPAPESPAPVAETVPVVPAVPVMPAAAQPPPSANVWRNRLILAGLMIVVLAGVGVAAFLFLGQKDQAWEHCKTLEKRTPEQRIQDCGAVIAAAENPATVLALAHRIRGRAFFDVGEVAFAVSDYSEALSVVTDDATLYSERGFARLRNGQPDKAVEDFTAAIGLDASLVEPMVGRGNAHLALSQPEQAAQDFSIALTLNPNLAEAVYRRALANVRLNRIADAAADYERALELSPKNPSYWNARCWFRATMSIDLDLALSDCDMALKLKPQFAPAMDSRAFVLLRLGKMEDALAAYDAAITAEPRYAWPYFGRGIVKKRLGDASGAEADFAAARERQPDIDLQYANYGETP